MTALKQVGGLDVLNGFMDPNMDIKRIYPLKLANKKESTIRLLKSLSFKLISSKYGVTQRHPENILPSCLTGSGPEEV